MGLREMSREFSLREVDFAARARQEAVLVGEMLAYSASQLHLIAIIAANMLFLEVLPKLGFVQHRFFAHVTR